MIPRLERGCLISTGCPAWDIVEGILTVERTSNAYRRKIAGDDTLPDLDKEIGMEIIQNSEDKVTEELTEKLYYLQSHFLLCRVCPFRRTN
ncbi:hypothetical protein A2774_05970 [Candidatus Roizmanbacteria bacterium RIFCSPHIGHO2_01_FULL_39_12c]|uniref:Uncharacterized protein n=1 Tax=Candidatus Roizmanbacteria bacterium RIFCSPHIGHO2_01_FULL_39_12c TaxID=1802031 RepID=A0A1F7G9J3_9BACT|nr:MAG: hypothetical protein A2774_05970 [Candidatus Roizmanbacteria bacterium RIFCSPHIGHO2_01_FULL_39_12c]OGK47233.1 MAG: hypothetical protein A2963_04170 [Candidatus Roizmanbacteria bacterium RIFCSPLOWO2_01_FULL_40_13]